MSKHSGLGEHHASDLNYLTDQPPSLSLDPERRAFLVGEAGADITERGLEDA